MVTHGGSWRDRRNAIQLLSASAAGEEASVSATATTDSLPAPPEHYRPPADSDRSSEDDGSDSDSDPAPVGNVTTTAARLTVTTSAPGPVKIAASLHGDGHLQRQCPHCKKRAKCPGEGVRPECRERAILHVMMCHARDMPDAAHQALAAQIIAEDPNVNNFRTTQVAPGATPGPANWTEHSDSQWGWFLRGYNRFKRMSAYSQRTAEKKLLGIVATVDGYLSRRFV